MNAERLLALANRLSEIEAGKHLQTLLQTVATNFQNLASSPAHEPHQLSAAKSLAQLEDGLREANQSLSPGEKSDLETLGGLPFFSPDLAAGIRASMQTNAVTPALVRDEANNALATRQQFIDTITQLKQRLAALGFAPEELGPAEAELGILFPRDVFQGDLPHLADELEDLAFAIDQFSEAVTGSREKIVVGQISTTDPIFFLLMPVAVVAAFATAAKQILDAIKSGLEVRQLWTQSKAVGLSEAQLEPFKAIIDQRIDAAISEAKHLTLANYPGDDARRNELDNGLERALRWLAPRIERGLIVEVRQPPPQLRAAGDDANEVQQRAAQAQEQLATVSQQLVFPKLTGEPLLQLSNMANDNGAGAPPPVQ